MSAAVTWRARALCGVPRAPQASSTAAVDLAAVGFPSRVERPTRLALLEISVKVCRSLFLGFLSNCI